MKTAMTIAEMWAAYSKANVHPQASDEQYNAMKIAFYSGACGVFESMQMPQSEEEAIAHFSSIQAEFSKFIADLDASVATEVKH